MANRTDPQSPVEKSMLTKIHQSTYWNEQCFGLTAETLVGKAMELDHIGGTFGGNLNPTPFMCLVMKMLQIQPEKEIVIEFIKNDDYRYVRVLGAFYLRLTGTNTDVYQYLEPLYNDYRKLRRKLADGSFSLTQVDEVIDELLTNDYSCNIAMPRIKKRWTLEATEPLELRKSALEEDFEEKEEKDQVDGSDDEDNKGRPDLLQTTAHGTTTVAIFFKGGILIGSDARVSEDILEKFTIEKTLELIKNEILESAMRDPYTGGRIRVFHVSEAVSHNICDDRLLEVYLTFLETTEKDERSILVLVPKESRHVTTKLTKHFTTFRGNKWAKSPPKLAILGDRNYLYRVRFMPKYNARNTFTKLHKLHSKYENDRRKEFEGMICHWIDEKTCVYAQIPSEELVGTLIRKFPDCDSKDESLLV